MIAQLDRLVLELALDCRVAGFVANRYICIDNLIVWLIVRIAYERVALNESPIVDCYLFDWSCQADNLI